MAILMTEEYWANTQLSIARHFGGVQMKGHEYWIVNKDGLDLFACSAIAEREGREKAIEPGEPADLVRQDFLPLYRKLGRDEFIRILKLHTHASDSAIKKEMQRIAKEKNGK